MPKAFRYAMLFFLLSATVYSAPKQLNSFLQLLEALKSGETVTAVIYYNKCRLVADGKEAKSPDQIAGMDMLPYEYFAPGSLGKNKGFISTSETVMIYLSGFNGYVYNYIKLRAYEDNTVEIMVRYLTTDKLEVQMDEMFYGEINDGINDKGIYFYSN